MKKYLIAIAMVLTLSSNATATAQKHRHTPRTEQVSDTVKHNPDAIEAFSDTTAAKSNANADFDDDDDSYTTRHHVTLEGEEAGEFMEKIFGGLGIAMIIPILAIVIFGLLLPLIILFTVLYFVNRNRRDKYRLAEMAIKNGQPIPDELLKEVNKDRWDNSEYNAGIRQMFTGIGLAIFLGIILEELGVGIGALVFFIGLGKWFIARQNRQTNNDNMQNYNNKESEL